MKVLVHLTDTELERAIMGNLDSLNHVKLNHLIHCPDCAGVVNLERKSKGWGPLVEQMQKKAAQQEAEAKRNDPLGIKDRGTGTPYNPQHPAKRAEQSHAGRMVPRQTTESVPVKTTEQTPKPLYTGPASSSGYKPYVGAGGGWKPYNSNPNKCPQCKGALATDECIVERCFGCGFDLSQCDEDLLEKIRKEANVEEEWDGEYGPRESFDPDPDTLTWAKLAAVALVGAALGIGSMLIFL